MRPEQTWMHREAAQAPTVAERQIAGLAERLAGLGEQLRRLDPPLVVTCGRGSSDHAATFAKYLVETRALTPVASYAPSVSSLYGTRWRKLRGALFLAISQSGQSPDIVQSALAARESGALVVAIVNAADSPLAQAAEVALPMLAGPERAVPATKSLIASLLAVLGLVAAWTGEADLAAARAAAPAVLRQAWQLDWSAAVAPLAAADSLFVLGRGLTLAAAQEAALKLKETCGLHAEAYSAAEVRHGPMALVGPALPLLLLAGADEGGEQFPALAGEFLARGAPVIVAGAAVPGAVNLPTLPALHPSLAPLAQVQSFYRLAAALSIARGRDPDQAPSLRKVTVTR